MVNNTVEQGKNIAVISYLTIFGTIIAYFLNGDKKNEFASFHIRQALGLWKEANSFFLSPFKK